MIDRRLRPEPRALGSPGLEGPAAAAFARQIIELTVAGYAALRDDDQVWKEEPEERDVLAGSLGDGLEADW